MSRIPHQPTSQITPEIVFGGVDPAFNPASRRRCLSGMLALAGLLLLTAGAQGQSVFKAWQNIGAPVTQTVTVTATTGGKVQTVEVLTNGATGLEFTKGGGTSTCESATLAAKGKCTVSVTFTPAYPGVRLGAAELLDANNDVLGTAYLSGVGQGGLDVLVPGNNLAIAGVLRQPGSTKSNIPATKANLDQPAGIALDGLGNLYISNSGKNHKVRMVCASATSATIAGVTCTKPGYIVDIAGTGTAGYGGDNGPAAGKTVELNNPFGLALDGAGNLYIADSGNNRIRKIAAATGIVTTVAGNGAMGSGGEGVPATSAELNNPLGVTIDAAGNLYIADTGNQLIRKVDAVTGLITTAAGNGKQSGNGDSKGTYTGDNGPANAAGLSVPYAVAFDVYGAMYIPDSGNNVIRVVNPKTTGGVLTATSIVSTYIGSTPKDPPCANGLTSDATLNSPEGVAIDASSNVYISDTGEQCVRKANVTTGNIVTLAKINDYAITVDNVPDFAQVYEPVGIVLDGLGNVYYADYYFMLIDEIQSNKAVLNYEGTPVRQGDLSAPQVQVVENDGNSSDTRVAETNVSPDITGITPDLNAQVDEALTKCNPLPYTLAQDTDCNIGAIFAPSTTIDPATLPNAVLGNIDVANDTINKLLDIVLIGEATPVNSTDIALTATPTPSEFGAGIALTATVTTGPHTGALTGKVTFSDSFNGVTTQLGLVKVDDQGIARLGVNTLAVGVHTLSAVYGGDPLHLKSSVPGTAPETIFEATNTTLTAAPTSPSLLGKPVTFTAKVAVSDGGGFPLDGAVTFTGNQVTFANNTIPLPANGVVTFTSSALAQGVNAITATYVPNTTTLIHGSEAIFDQDVVAAATVSVTSSPNPSTYGSPVTFTVSVPNSGKLAATGKVDIAIVPVGATNPVYSITATLSGNPATGMAPISTLPVGSYNATATYEGNPDFSKAKGTLATPQVVNQVLTTTAAVAVPDPGIAGKPVEISATVKAASGNIAPSGTVIFTDTFNGTATILGAGAITLGNAGTASVNAALAPGTHSILVAYSGNADDAKSSFTLSLVVKQATTSTVVIASPNPVTVEGAITFTATVTGNGGVPTGAVRFLANGTTSLGTANLDTAGKATVTNSTLAAGSYQITAVYAGDTDDAGSTSPAITEVVGLIPTATGLTTASTTGANSQTILVATVDNHNASGPTPTGTVTFKSGNTVIGSAILNANGVATLTPNLTTGTYSIIAYYPGDTLHGPSQSKSVSVTGQGSSFTITLTPASVTVAATQNVNTTVTLTSISGFTDTIGLGCASLPAGVNCHFDSISVPLAANAKSTTQLTIDTNNPLGGGATAMNRPSAEHKVQFAGLLLPFSLFLGSILWRFRKRHSSVWSVVLILVLSGAALLATGCSGFTQNSAAPGTYTIQVVGVGANSNVTQYQTVTLNITK
jgi:hypothetical protein